MADSNLDIWRLQAQADIQGLIEALQHSDPEIRRRAATALRALGATSAIPALQATLVDERDTDIRNTILSVLDYLFEQEIDDDGEEASDEPGGPHQVVYWIAQLTSDKADQIIHAAQYLAEAKEKIAVETLILVFRNTDLPAHARLAAADALIKLESAPVEVTLLAALRHPDWRTRRNAAAVLAQIGADWAVEPLAAALHDDNEMVRKTAYAALKHLATPEALEAIQPPPITNAPVAKPPVLEPQLLADLSSQPKPAPPAKPAAPSSPVSEPKPVPPVNTAPAQPKPSPVITSPQTAVVQPSAPARTAEPQRTEPANPAAVTPAPTSLPEQEKPKLTTTPTSEPKPSTNVTPVSPALPLVNPPKPPEASATPSPFAPQPLAQPVTQKEPPKPSLAAPVNPVSVESEIQKPVSPPPVSGQTAPKPEIVVSGTTEAKLPPQSVTGEASSSVEPAPANPLPKVVTVDEPTGANPTISDPPQEEDTRPMPSILEDDVT